MNKYPWEIENININMDDETKYLHKFVIYDELKLIQSGIFEIGQENDIVNVIQNSQNSTGIMISNLKINNLSIYLIILDSRIFIINQINLSKYQEYFNDHKN